jgi:threonine dehydrogenase-like Zn-dependent dehydrogenase
MGKNLTLRMGNCNHRKYIPGLVRTGAIDTARVLTQDEQLSGAVGAYEAFDRRQAGWMKVELEPSQ